MKTPHQHAYYIKAWADGEPVEYLTQEGWMPLFKGWSWDNLHVEAYRIRPEPKPDLVVYYQMNLNGICSARLGITGSNLKMIFDGETHKLKAAEVLHGR